MAEPWRFHSPASNLCPFCSSPHFPFCPPPPHPPPLPHAPFYPTFRPPPPPPMTNHPSNDFVDAHGPPTYKRLRLDEPPPPLPPTSFDNPHYAPRYPPDGRFLYEDERRIGLIRDHGGPVGFTPPPMVRHWENQSDGGYNRDLSMSGPGNWNGAGVGYEAGFGRQNMVSERNWGEDGSSRNYSGVEVVADHRGGSFRGSEFESRNAELPSGRGAQASFSGNFVGDYRDGDSKRSLDVHADQFLENRRQEWEQERERPAVHPSSDYGLQGLHGRFEYNGQEQMGQHRVRDVGQYLEPTMYRPSGDMHTTYSQPMENKYEQLPDHHYGLKRNYSEFNSYSPRPFELEATRVGSFGEGSYASLPDGRNNNSMVRGMETRNHGSELYPPHHSVNIPERHPEAPQQPSFEVSNSSSLVPKTLFPVLPSSSSAASFSTSANVVPEHHSLPRPNCYSVPPAYSSSDMVSEGLPLSHHTPPELYPEERRPKVAIDHPFQKMATVIDAYSLFKPPYRTSRPDHIVIILRGLPGSGKSYLAKALRDLEVENGGNAPRIHAMDDYFMVEVEKKVEESDSSRSSSSSRAKRPMTKKVIEYCYEPDMEETYRASMLKAFTKTLDEGIFTFIIVDDRNLRVADFAQFWAIAKRSGYEVYLLEAPYKDPTGCTARNVHGFTLDDVQKMSEQWEEAPAMYLRLDTQSLFRGDSLNEDSIQEVDMDTDDDELPNLQDKKGPMQHLSVAVDYKPDQAGERWDSEEDEEKENNTSKVKDLGSSKWSKDFDEEIEYKESNKQNVNALSGLIQSYSKKSVHWCDQAGKNGFSIGALKKLTGSLIIGPGSGYNYMSNPVIDDKDEGSESGSNNYTKKKFNDQLRAESESFRAVFDKRRHRIGGFNNAEDD